MAPYYENAVARERLIDEAAARGEVMIHDNFKDADGNDTDGVNGQLIFAAPEPTPIPTAEEIDARTIEAKMAPTHDELVRLLRFKGVIGGK